MLRSCFIFVCLCLYVAFAIHCVSVCSCMLQGCVPYCTCVQITRLVCFLVIGSLCACMLRFRVIVYAFAFVCCRVAFHITRVCRLHVRFASCSWFVCLCLFVYSTCVCVCVCPCHVHLSL